MSLPLITLSVPVYGTESYLPYLLDSIAAQSLFNGSSPLGCTHCCSAATGQGTTGEVGVGSIPFEVLIVNDASPCGAALNKIIKPYKKIFTALGGTIRLLEHRKNLGLVEARRTAVLYAQGRYFLFADSDDTLPVCALQSLYEAACFSGADIVHGKAEYKTDFTCRSAETEAGYTQEKLAVMDEKIKKVHAGFLHGYEILDSLLLEGGHNSFLWGKLFRTDLLRRAFDDIPHTFCTMTEDLLIYFFALLHIESAIDLPYCEDTVETGKAIDCNTARNLSAEGSTGTYYGIEDIVYTYYIGRGISSNQEITDLTRWERACSAASVFTIIFSYLEDHPLHVPNAAELTQALRNLNYSHFEMNRKHLNRVAPTLLPEAKKIFEEYWGIALN